VFVNNNRLADPIAAHLKKSSAERTELGKKCQNTHSLTGEIRILVLGEVA
jgi:hypothetical protein